MKDSLETILRFILIPFIPNLLGNSSFTTRFFYKSHIFDIFKIFITLFLAYYVVLIFGLITNLEPPIYFNQVVFFLLITTCILRFIFFPLSFRVMWNLAKNGIKSIVVNTETIDKFYNAYPRQNQKYSGQYDVFHINEWIAEKYKLKGYLEIVPYRNIIIYSDRRDLPYLIFRNS